MKNIILWLVSLLLTGVVVNCELSWPDFMFAPQPEGLQCFEIGENLGGVICDLSQGSPFTEDVLRLTRDLKFRQRISLANNNGVGSHCTTIQRAEKPYTGKVDICGHGGNHVKWEAWCIGDDVRRIVEECSGVVAKGKDGKDERSRTGGKVFYSGWGSIEVSS